MKSHAVGGAALLLLSLVPSRALAAAVVACCTQWGQVQSTCLVHPATATAITIAATASTQGFSMLPRPLLPFLAATLVGLGITLHQKRKHP